MKSNSALLLASFSKMEIASKGTSVEAFKTDLLIK